MTQRKVFLHVGPPKTGSTTIQSMLDRSWEEFLREGILYPVKGRPPEGDWYWVRRPQGRVHYRGPMLAHHFLAWTLMNEVEEVSAEVCWGELREELEATEAASIVISSEAFARLTPEQIRRARSYLSACEVYVVLYLRDPFSRILSDYTQNVKKGRATTSFKAFIREQETDLCPFGAVISRWGEVVGDEHMIVRLVEHNRSGFSLEHDFVAALGEDPRRFEHCFDQRKANPSPSPELVRLMILINRLEGALGRKETFGAIFEKIRRFATSRQGFAKAVAAIGGSRYRERLFDAADREFIRERCDPSFSKLVQKYVGNA